MNCPHCKKYISESREEVLRKLDSEEYTVTKPSKSSKPIGRVRLMYSCEYVDYYTKEK